MTNNLPNGFLLKKHQWFDGDKYLSSVIRSEIDVFSEEFDLLNDNVLNLLPSCRKYARINFQNLNSLADISSWFFHCDDDESVLSKELIGLFFLEDIEQKFVNLFAEKFAVFIQGMKEDEIKVLLVNELNNLGGASFKRLALRKWER